MNRVSIQLPIRFLLAFWGYLLISWSSCALAQSVLPPFAWVVDQTGTLNAEQMASLTLKLERFAKTNQTELAVVVVRSTQPEAVEGYANRLASVWKLGDRQTGRGAVLLVALEDRRVRIEVSRALEGDLPDLAAHRILSGVVTPALRAGQVYEGLDQGVHALMRALAAESAASSASSEPLAMDQSLEAESAAQAQVAPLLADPLAQRMIVGFVLGMSLMLLAVVGVLIWLVRRTFGRHQFRFYLLALGATLLVLIGREIDWTTSHWLVGAMKLALAVGGVAAIFGCFSGIALWISSPDVGARSQGTSDSSSSSPSYGSRSSNWPSAGTSSSGSNGSSDSSRSGGGGSYAGGGASDRW